MKTQILCCAVLSAFILSPVLAQEKQSVVCFFQPISCLNNDGDEVTVTDIQNDSQSNSFYLTWFQPLAGEEKSELLEATVENPNNPAQELTITVNRKMIGNHYQAFLFVRVAESLEMLLDESQASLFTALPAPLLVGSLYFEIDVMVRTEAAASFQVLGQELWESYPLELSLNGLTLPDAERGVFYHYPTIIEVTATNSIALAATRGDWSLDTTSSPQFSAATLTAKLYAGSTYAACSEVIPALATDIDLESPLQMTAVTPGESSYADLTLTNAGGGILEGGARWASNGGAFQVPAPANYRLGPGESQTLRLQFSPTLVQEYSDTLYLSGDPYGDFALAVLGSASAAPKVENFLGCGAGNPAPHKLSDVLIIGLSLALLCLSGKKKRFLQGG